MRCSARGTYVVVGVKDMGRWLGLGRQIKALLLSPLVRQRMRVFVVRHNRQDLAVLKELVEAGKVAPVIDRRFAEDTPTERSSSPYEGAKRPRHAARPAPDPGRFLAIAATCPTPMVVGCRRPSKQ